ncbi:uncharacterized protein LOC113340856 [Papaver somniferum]|uniref:uncharacterized protein LOC113340856 n=1 Tax=Papaver somniferum TaxID=3469 RepID=UPI000E6FBBC6|nr:uncharacterized protein LOC113340856 [Papaver somniferum]
MVGVYAPRNNVIVITAWIGMFRVHRILVDAGSSVSVLFSGAYSSMNLPHDLIEEDENPIVGFSGEVTKTIGKVKIPITVANKYVLGNFLLLDCRAPYNAIVGRDWMHEIDAVISSYHQCLKFITPEGVVKVRSDQIAAHKCHESAMDEYKKSESFADMPGIDPNVSCHRLNIDEKFHPVRQKIRNIAQSKKDGVTAEVEKLLEAGFIRPVQYARWMSTVVLVSKKNGKIRVCIDFTDLNKACPRDPYPLPRIRD